MVASLSVVKTGLCTGVVTEVVPLKEAEVLTEVVHMLAWHGLKEQCLINGNRQEMALGHILPVWRNRSSQQILKTGLFLVDLVWPGAVVKKGLHLVNLEGPGMVLIEVVLEYQLIILNLEDPEVVVHTSPVPMMVVVGGGAIQGGMATTKVASPTTLGRGCIDSAVGGVAVMEGAGPVNPGGRDLLVVVAVARPCPPRPVPAQDGGPNLSPVTHLPTLIPMPHFRCQNQNLMMTINPYLLCTYNFFNLMFALFFGQWLENHLLPSPNRHN